MELSTAKQILSLLADGIDPEMGEILPEDSVCNHPCPALCAGLSFP